jgi:hypothetical protein
MCNFGVNVNDKFESDKITSVIRLEQGKSNACVEDGAMHYGFIIKVSKEYLKDMKILRYISNIMRNENADVAINIIETEIEVKITYINHIHVKTISELSSYVEADINSSRKSLSIFEIYEYEVISLFYLGNIPLEIDQLTM